MVMVMGINDLNFNDKDQVEINIKKFFERYLKLICEKEDWEEKDPEVKRLKNILDFKISPDYRDLKCKVYASYININTEN